MAIWEVFATAMQIESCISQTACLMHMLGIVHVEVLRQCVTCLQPQGLVRVRLVCRESLECQTLAFEQAQLTLQLGRT
jgi:hypothetical protein